MAESSRVRSNHWVAVVNCEWRGAVMRCLASAQARSERMGLRL